CAHHLAVAKGDLLATILGRNIRDKNELVRERLLLALRDGAARLLRMRRLVAAIPNRHTGRTLSSSGRLHRSAGLTMSNTGGPHRSAPLILSSPGGACRRAG